MPLQWCLGGDTMMLYKYPIRIYIALLLALGARTLAAAAVEAPGANPDTIQAALKAGNERYIAGKALHPNTNLERREQTADKGQQPQATILSCSDSRVPVEVVFDQGVGDTFVIRNAGNVSSTEAIGSIEYGVEHLGTPLLVVMGHTKCGAVTAAATGAEVGGSIPDVIAHILPAVKAVRDAHPGEDPNALVPAMIEANVWQSIAELYRQSAITREHVHEGKLRVVGAIYDIQSGRVRWLGSHPREKELLESGPAKDGAGAGQGNGATQKKGMKAAPQPVTR